MSPVPPPTIRFLLYAAAVFLAAGVFPLPYAYYTLLRVVGSVAFIFAAWVAFSTHSWATLLLAALGILALNPVIPLRLSKELWACIDAGLGVLLAIIATHIQNRFSAYAPPEVTVESVAKVLGLALLLGLLGGVGLTVLVGIVVIPLKWLGISISAKFLNPLAYGAASGIAVAVLTGYAYHSGQGKPRKSEA